MENSSNIQKKRINWTKLMGRDWRSRALVHINKTYGLNVGIDSIGNMLKDADIRLMTWIKDEIKIHMEKKLEGLKLKENLIKEYEEDLNLNQSII